MIEKNELKWGLICIELLCFLLVTVRCEPTHQHQHSHGSHEHDVDVKYRIRRVDHGIKLAGSEGHSHHHEHSEDPNADGVGIVAIIQSPLSKKKLKSLAGRLIETQGLEADRVRIAYFLDGMKIESPAWASVTISPHGHKVEIIGVPPEKLKALQSVSYSGGGTVVKRWLDPGRGGGLWLLLRKESGFQFQRRRPKDTRTFEVLKTEGDGSESYAVEGSSWRYVVREDGALEIHDKQGLRRVVSPEVGGEM